MRKLAFVLCLALVPVLGWSQAAAPEVKPAAEKPKVIVAMTGIRSGSLNSTRSLIFTETVYSSLSQIKGISVIPQKTIESLNLTIVEKDIESIKKAGAILKAERIVCFFIEGSNSDNNINFYVYDGKTGDLKFMKSDWVSDSVTALKIIRSDITQAEANLVGDGNSLNNAKAKPSTDRLNVEMSLVDFLDKKTVSFRNPKDTLFLAANYKMYSTSKELVLAFGPFFSLNWGLNDIGARATGYYYPFTGKDLNIYISVSANTGIALKTGEIFVYIQPKIGLDLGIGQQFELFGEGGIALGRSGYANLIIYAGARVYLF